MKIRPAGRGDIPRAPEIKAKGMVKVHVSGLGRPFAASRKWKGHSAEKIKTRSDRSTDVFLKKPKAPGLRNLPHVGKTHRFQSL